MEYYDISTSPGPNDWEEEERELNGFIEEDGDGGGVEVEEKVKHEKADPVLSSQVVAILNELGHYNRMTNTYQLNQADSQSCLRDLIRFLRNDGNSFFVRRQMGISNIVNNDLLPIIEQHTVDIHSGNISHDGKLIMDKVIRLLVDLTNPTMLHYRDGRVPKNDKEEIPIYLQLQQILFKYKISFALKKRFWVVLAKHLSRILSLDEVDRELEDTHMFERIIILIRNVLHIPVMEDHSQKNSLIEGINIQDRIIEYLHEFNIMDIFQYMISSNDFNEYCFHLIEIIFLIYREQSAEFIAKSIHGDPLASENLLPEDRASLLASAGRSDYEIDIDRKEIEDARLRDRHALEDILKKVPKYGSGKYSRPTFIVKGMKSISDRDMICHQPYFNPELEIDLNKDKKSKTRARNRRLMEENIDNSDAMGVRHYHKSSRKIRLILSEFANKFLADCFNSFMKNIRNNLSRGASQDHDETYYLWAIQFFLEFNRFRPKVTNQQRFDCVAETLNGNIFHYIQTLMDDYLEHLGQKQFKVELGDWAKRLHCALRTYKELLFTLQNFDGFEIPEAKKLSHKIKTDIFIEQEYRELLLRLLKDYDEMKMSKAYLRDLIETNHLFLKMLEYHVKVSYNFKVHVNKKVIKRSNKQKKKKTENGQNDEENDESQNKAEEDEVQKDPEVVWNEISERLKEMLSNDSAVETNIIEATEDLRQLFDPLSERNLDEQKLYLMRKINYLLLEKDIEKAIGLFREARLSLLGIDEDNTFGDMNMSAEDELAAFKEIIMADFPKESFKKDDDDEDQYDENAENDQDEDEMSENRKKEIYFNMDDTVRNYSKAEILRAYRIMLKNYRHNKPETNHAIVRMLYRIAVDLKMTPMFFNLGYLLCFEKILSDPALKYRQSNSSTNEYVKTIKDLADFARFVTRKFFKLLHKYPKISAELCFAANSRDAYSMEYGFDDYRVGTELKAIKEKKNNIWSDEQILELEVLFKEYQEKIENGQVELKQPNGKKKDIVDLVQEHLIDKEKTRRQIMAQLRKMGLLQNKLRTKRTQSDVVVQYSSGEEDNADFNQSQNDNEEEEAEAQYSDADNDDDKDKEHSLNYDDVDDDSNEKSINKESAKPLRKDKMKSKNKKNNSNFFNIDDILKEHFEPTVKKKSRAVIYDSDNDDDKENDQSALDNARPDSPINQDQNDIGDNDDSIRKSRVLRIDDDEDEEEHDGNKVEEDYGEEKQGPLQSTQNKRKRAIFDEVDEGDHDHDNDYNKNSDHEDDSQDFRVSQPKRKRLLIDDDDDEELEHDNNPLTEAIVAEE